MQTSKPQFVAHRGYQKMFPENSLAAIQGAIECGATHIEIDIQITKDHRLVLFHDKNLKRMTGAKGKIAEHTLSQLKPLPLKEAERFGEQFIHERIATLEQVCALIAKHPGITLYVEVKAYCFDYISRQDFFPILENMLKPIKQQAIIMSFDAAIIAIAKTHKWPRLGLVVNNWQQTQSRAVQLIQPECLFCNAKYLPRGQRFDTFTPRLVIYEVGSTTMAESLFSRGINHMETFDVKTLLEHDWCGAIGDRPGIEMK